MVFVFSLGEQPIVLGKGTQMEGTPNYHIKATVHHGG